MNSIIQNYEEEHWCYHCGSPHNLHSHHCICGSARRKKAEQYGLKVLLCSDCHVGAHNQNSMLLKELQRLAQREFEKEHTREEFIKEFGVSCL